MSDLTFDNSISWESQWDFSKLNSSEIKRIKEGKAPFSSISFACGGWLQFYMFGVAKALQTMGVCVEGKEIDPKNPSLGSTPDRDVRYYGCSAGSLAAVGLAAQGEFDEAIQFCKDECIPSAYGDIGGLFRLQDYVKNCIDKCVLSRMDIDSLVANNQLFFKKKKLNVATTKLPNLQPIRFNEFKSKEQLLNALCGSCAAFPFAQIVRIGDHWHIDGGLSDFQPVEDDDTITVSPLYFSDTDIKPSRYVPLWWTFMPPSSEDTIDWLYHLGFDDGVSFLRSKGFQVPENKVKKFHIDHPYNKRKRVSIHRFLGYNVEALTHRSISMVLDVFLLFLLLFIWKPLALILIYIELFLKIGKLFFMSSLHTIVTLSPPFISKLFTFSRSPLYKFYKSSVELSLERKKMFTELWECVLCVASLSLFLRFLTRPLPKNELKKHKKLSKVSLVYRVCRHFI